LRGSEGTCLLPTLSHGALEAHLYETKVKETCSRVSALLFRLYFPYSPSSNAKIVGQRFERMQCHSQVPRPRLRSCRRKK
jgi:hypothetical protein